MTTTTTTTVGVTFLRDWSQSDLTDIGAGVHDPWLGSVVGGADALKSDDADGSYSEVWNAYPASCPSDPGYDEHEYALDPAPVATDGTNYRLMLRVRARTLDTAGTTTALQMLLYAPERSVEHQWSGPYRIDVVDGAYTTYDLPILTPVWWSPDLARDGTWSIDLAVPSGLRNCADPLNGFRVTQLQMLITYDHARVRQAPPCRVHPRDDGRGTASASRVYPPPQSQQGSSRRGPGSYW